MISIVKIITNDNDNIYESIPIFIGFDNFHHFPTLTNSYRSKN